MKLSEAAPALVLKAILVQGGAFRAAYAYMNEDPKQRYFFVGNHRPTDDATIILLTPTTQIDKRRAKHRERADLVLVPITRAEYPELTEDSVVDCDCAVIKRPRATFEKQALARQYTALSRLPERIIVRIRSAIAAARTLSAHEKRLILGPEPDGSND